MRKYYNIFSFLFIIIGLGFTLDALAQCTPPTTPIINTSPAGSVCGQQTITFSVDPSTIDANTTYQWTFGDSASSSNTATGTTVVHTFTPNPSGASYTVKVKAIPNTAMPQAVNWTDLNNTTVLANNSLKKTSSSYNYNAGAASTQTVGEGEAVGFVANDNVKVAVGLSTINLSRGLNTINYALVADGLVGDIIQVHQNSGTPVGGSGSSFGNFTTGDTLGVGVLNGNVVYYKNGTIIYTSTIAPTLPLIVDVSIPFAYATIDGAFVTGLYCTSSASTTVTTLSTPNFTIGSNAFDKAQTCQTIIPVGNVFNATFAFSSGYNAGHTYQIDYGDGGGFVPFVGNITAHTYTSPGVYTVTVTGSNGTCTSSYVGKVYYLDRPLADMSINGTADVCEGETVYALNNTDTIDHRVVYYVWEWGDGTLDTIYYKDTASHIFNLGLILNCSDVPAGGKPYNVTLYAVNECFQHTNTSPITVSKTPTGNLSSVQVECVSVASTTGINFGLDYCTYGIAGSPSWNFGDPASGILNTLAFPLDAPNHIFAGGPGLYTVSVHVGTLCGDYYDSVTVHILEEPVANVTFSTNGSTPANGDGCNPTEVYFNNTSTGDSLTFNWTVTPSAGVTFIDGTNNTTGSAHLLFNTAGDFIVTMAAINRCDTSYYVDTIRILDGPNITLNTPNPTCDSFTYSPSVTYFDGGGVINSYAWEFRQLDGTILGTSNQDFPTYNFTSPGTYVVEITIINDCTTKSETDTFTIQATPGPITANGGVPIETCINNPTFTITTDYPGGTWSGTGITAGGVFDPSSVVAGTYTVYYHYDIGNGCPADVPFTVIVHPLPVVDAGANVNKCVNNPPFNLTTGTPLGGTWSGTGITDATLGTFNPALAGVGSHLITYTYTNSNNCTNTDILYVNVLALPNVNAQGDVTYCDVDYNILLNTPSPTGGTWTGQGIVSNNPGMFNIDSAGGLGTYTLIYTFADANGCQDADTIDVTTINNLTVNAGAPDTICINNGIYTLSGTPIGGTWTGPGVLGIGPDFSPSVAGLGSKQLIYTYSTSSTCKASDTVNILISDFTPVNAGNDTLVCAETDAFTLAATPIGGVWSGTGISGNTFNPNTSGTGAFTLTYAYTNPVTGCVSEDYKIVTVAPLPNVNAGGTFTMCDTAASFPITGYSPTGGTWAGPGITNPNTAMFNPSLAGGIGQYTLYYTYINNNGCENTDSLLMDVVYGDTLKLTKPRDTICINNGTYTITGFEPTGGTWTGNGIIGTGPNFSPSAAGIGTHTLTYKVGTGSCQKQITMQIIVQDIPVVYAGTDTLVCKNQPVFTLTGYSPAGGVWSGTGIINGNLGTFNPSISSGTYPLTYTYTDPVTGCYNTDTKIVTVSPLPVVSVPSTVTHCLIPDDIQLTNYNPAGGTWSGAGIVDANNGIFNGDTAGGLGIYNLVYSYTDGNQCTNSAATTLTVIGIDTAQAGPGDTLCVYNNPINLTGNLPAGGTWSGTGITNASAGTFDPGQVSAGVYTITYTVNTGTCQNSDQTTVLVGGVPNVNAQANEVVCADNPAFTLLTATPANGVWSGTGIIDAVNGVFDPAVSGTGLHTLTYTYTNPITGCSNSDTKNVRVRPLPTVNTQGAVTYCNTPANIQLTGFTPTSGGIWSGPGIVDANNGVFNPITAGNVGQYAIVLTYTNSNNCTNFDTLHITVTAGDTVNAGPNDTLCISDAPIMLGGYPAGGNWSGSGITNSSGVFDPGQVAAGFHYPIYTVGTGTCERKDTIEIYVSGLPFVSAGNDIQMCIDAGITTLTGQTPLTGYWSGNGITDSIAGTFDPVLAGAGLHTISYVVTNVYGCDNVDTRTVRVYPLPTVNAGDTVVYCYTSDNIQLTGFTPSSGGIWSGTGIVDANNGVFNANSAGATGIGIYDNIVLTYTNNNNCTNLDTLVVQIVFGDTIDAGPDFALCIDNGLDTLSGYIPTFGGSWSGVGIVNSNLGIFDPSIAGGGLHNLIYTFGTGTCLKRDTVQVNVGIIPTVVAGSNQVVCIDEPAFNFTGFSPPNGTWSGNGITNATLGTFDAATAGVGLHTLTYTFINTVTGCENYATKTVRVNPLPIVNGGSSVVYCNNPNNITLSGYSPLGGAWSGSGIIDAANGIFNTISAGGIGTYYPIYTYTNANGCTNFDTLEIDVIFGDTVDAGPAIGVCVTDGIVTINNGYTPSSGGTWSGPGIVDAANGLFDPSAVATNTSHTLTYTYGTGTCQKTDVTTIFVGTVPMVEAGLNDTICQLDGLLQLTGFVPASGGTWSGAGIVNPSTGVFNPLIAGVGTHTLTYYYINTFTGCENQDTKTVTVIAAPTVNAGNDQTVCNNNNDITLSGFSPLGGVWTGSGITSPSGIFNTVIAGGEGVYNLTYTYTDGNGCSNSDIIQYTVIYGDTVSAGPNRNVCIDGGFVNLGGSPAGGIWAGTGIIDPTGIFDPQVAGTGFHTLGYTYGSGTCQKTDYMTVFVSPALTINAGPDLSVCEAEPVFNLTGNVPSTGGTWSGTGITNTTTGTFNPSLAGVGTHIITYTFTNTNTGCSDTDTRIITVTPPPTVNAGNDQIYCNSNQNITLSGYSPSGGVWSGSGIVDPLAGAFNTQSAGGIGTYQLVYSYSSGSCADKDTIQVDVIYGDTVVAGLPDTVCVDASQFTLTGFSPIGGTWSGTGIIDGIVGVFDPATAGAGIHTISYTYGTGTCQKTVTKNVVVDALPVVNAGNNQAVCIDNAAFNFTGYSPLNGTWSGTGVTNATTGTFNPATAGVGTHTITYTYVNPFTGCDAFDTKTVTVNPLPIITMADTVEYCNSGNNITLSGYSPTGGTWSGAGIVDAGAGIFNASQAGGIGTYTLTYAYTNANGCTNTEDLVVDIIFGDTVVAGVRDTVCIDESQFALTGYSPLGGTWSGTGIIDAANGIFDPATAGAGTHTLSYTYGTGTCQKTATKVIVVGALPVVNAGSDQTVCVNNAAFNFTGFSPNGGTWSGTGVTNTTTGTFNPATAGVGTHTITYTYVNPFTGCDAFDTKTVTVNPLPIITMADTVEYCNSGNNITLSGYSPTGGTWSGAGIVDAAAGIFNASQAGGIGTYTLTYAYTNANGCTNTEDLIVDIIFGDTVVAGTNQAVCVDALSFNLTGFSPAGGTWTGTGIIDAAAGIFDPTTAGVGTHVLTYTFGTGTCQKTVTKTVTVNALPIVNAGADQTICINTPEYILSGQSPTGGVWTGTGITDGTIGLFDAATAGLGTHTITYTYTNPSTGCDAFDTKVITINPLPIITMPDTLEYCNVPNDITLTGYSPTGGTWSGAGIVNATSGIFNASQAGGIGTYTVTYAYTNTNGCTNTETLVVDIIFGDTVIAGVRDTVCIDENQFALTGYSPLGGTWSGTGIIDAANGIFDPATAGAGTHVLSYTYGTGTCQKTAIKRIVVGALPVVNAGNNQTVCINNAAFNFTGFSPNGGTWSGTGITNATTGTFNPATAGVGTHTITYTYVNPFTGCDAFDTKTVTVNPLPIITMPDTVEYCNSANNITLSGYSPTGGTWSGAGIVDAAAGIFNASQAGGIGTYTVTYAYTNANGCTNTANLTIDIIFGDTVVAGTNQAVCVDALSFNLTGFSPAGGTWTGTGIIDAAAGIFDPATAGVGTHVLTYTFGSGTCQKVVTKTVTVNALPIVNAGADQNICINTPQYVLSGHSPTGGIWTGTGITDGTIGTFDAATAGIGTHTITYTYTNPSTGCDAFDTKVITINALPVITMPDTLEYCNVPNDITLTGYSPTGGTWSGAGIVNATSGIFNASQAGGIGTYTVTYAYTNTNGCTNTETLVVDIIFGDTVVAGVRDTVCIDESQFALTGYSPIGGTWSGTGIIDAANGIFDPATAGAGTHTLSYTYGTGTCQKTATKVIVVGALPVVNAGSDQTVCVNNAAFNLAGYSPLGGTWTGTGVSNTGIFNPATAGVGVHTLTYTYVNPFTGCDAFDTKVITVNGLPTITMPNTLVYCDNPSSITLTGYSPTGGLWTGAGIIDATNGIFNTTQAGGIGIYTLTYTYTNANGCSNSGNVVVEVIYGDTVVAGPNISLCIDAGLTTLTGFSPVGGTWSGTGIVDATNGIYDPIASGVGTHTITYSYGSGTCLKTVSSTVVVNSLPIVSAGNDLSTCINSPEFMLSGQSPTGGIWTGTGITDGTVGLFNPTLAGIGTHTLTYTYTNGTTGCSASDTKLVTVNPLPIVTVQDTVYYCFTPNNITLSGYSPQGGTWSGTGIVDGNNGVFNGNSAGGVGTYQVVYSYEDANTCINSDTMIIVVEPSVTVNAGSDISLCIDNGNYQLTGFSPAGGTWSGAGIVNPNTGLFDPQLAGGGLHTLTYTYGTGSCLSSDQMTVFVGTIPVVNAGTDRIVCFTDNAFSLNGFSPPSGIWTGNGITNPIGVFDPATAGVGTHTLTYTFTNSTTGCEDFDTKLVTVLPPPAVNAGDTVIYCNTNQNVTLTNYTPAGGIWTGSGVVDNANGIFNPNVAGGEGTYHLTYAFTDANGCSNFDSLVVQIIYGDTVRAGVPDTVCIDDAQFTLTGFIPASGGIWSGTGIVDANIGVFDPTTAGVGNHTIAYTFGTGTCQKTATKTVFVGALPTINLGLNDTVCVNSAAFNIGGYSPQGGTWSGIGITNGNAGTFDPSIAGIGTHTISYTFVNTVTGCDRTSTKKVIVRPLPTVFVTNITYCNNPNDITLTGFSPAGGVWSGSGIVATTGVFNSTIAGGIGTYTLTYTYEDNIGCANTANMIVDVIFGDTVEAGPNVNICIDDAPITLTGQLPTSGGIWTGNGIINQTLGIFDPATAGVGNHILTWTYGTGTCLKTSTRTVTVSNPPNVSAGLDELHCINDAPFVLSSYSPIGGVWSGTGITDSIAGIFDPSVSGVGSFTLTYYYYNTVTNCDAFDTKLVVIAPLPIVSTGDSVIYCNNPNNITLSGYSPQGGTWSGPGVLDGAAGIFNTVQAGGIGTYTLTYTYTGVNGCTNSDDLIVDIIFGDTVQAGGNLAVCIDDGLVTLTGQLPTSGGIWSGVGIIDPIVGIFDPVTAGTGTHILTWTYGTGTCQKTSTRTITVTNPPNVSAGVDKTFCIDAAPIVLNGYSPTGGTWSGTGITDSIAGIFDPSVSGIGTFTLTYYYYNASTNCDASDTKIVTVVPLPIVATGDSVTYCANPNNITLTGYSPAGGIWSGPGVIDPSAGIFTTTQAGGIGTYTLTYTYTNANGCTNSKDLIVDVIFGDTVQAGPGMSVCIDDGLVTLTGQLPTSGGTWSGNGIIDPVAGIFDPVTAGTGVHILTWTYGTGTCQKTSTRTIRVSNPPTVSAGVDKTYCINNAPIILNGYSPTGGYWSGTGITDSIAGVFSPAVAGIGTFTLTYYYFNATTNCDAFDTKIVTVAPLPIVATGDSVTYCANPNNITLTGYSPTGGTWSGAGVIDPVAGIFTTTQAGGIGTYTLTYAYTDGNGCTNSKDLIVDVIFGDTVQAGPAMAVCIDDGLVTLTGQLPASGGTWSGNGIIDPIAGIFDPVTAGAGTHILTWTYGTGTCLKTSTRTIAVSNPPTVNAGADRLLCINNAPIIFSSYSPAGGIWSGVGITDSIAGIFDPAVSGVGTFTLTYYYYNASTNCDAFDTKVVTVAPLPTVTAMAAVTYCANPNNITLTGYSPQGGVWTGAGIIDANAGIFNTSQAGGLGYNNGDTTYTLTYTFTNSNGCQNTANMTVDVIFGDTVVAGPAFAICQDAGAITLSGQTPLGGTWSGTGISDPTTGIFDPAVSGVGTFILTYTYGTGTCQKISTRTVTVGAVPAVNAGVDLNLCEDNGTLVLGGQTPIGGAWSGIGITDTAAGIFDPTVSGLGTFTIIYTFTNNVTGCEGVDTRIIKVNPLPIVTTEDSVFYCLTSNNIQLTGFTPTTGGQWSGPGIVNPNTGVFNSGQAGGLGTYNLTYTYTDANGCTNSEDLYVDVSFGDTVVAGPNMAVCITDAPFTLTGNTPTTGGTWSGNGIIDPVLGVFDPSDAGQGTHVLTWTYGTGTCEKTSTRTIVVGSPPSVVAGIDQFVCIDAGQVFLSGYSPVGGTWDGMGIVDSIVGIFDPVTAGLGQHTISYYVVNTVTGCENTDYKTITVGDIPPVSVTDSVIFCANPNNIILTDYVTVSPPNGIWSGPGVVDPVNGIFSTTIAGGLGNYNLIYTFSGSNSCENSDTLNISVIYGDTVLAGPNDTLCLGENPIVFTGFSPAGGTWSGPGIINSNAGEFDPNFAGVGLHTVTYTYGSGTCEKKVTKKVLVDAPPTISIGPDQTVCIDATPFILGGYSPQGGTWSGVGITNPTTGLFNPVTAGIGTHTLTYEFVNSISGCSNTDSRDITVVPLPVVYAGDTLEFCNSNTNIVLSNYINYSPLGGTWSGPGIVDPANGIFNTISAGGIGEYDITYGITDGNGCYNDDQAHISVIYGDTVVAGPNVALCIDAGLYQLTGFSPFGGLWSSANSNSNNAIVDAVNGIIDVQAAGAGPHTFIYTYGTGTCQKTATRVVFVGTPPVVNPGANQTICIDAPTFTLTGFSPAGGVWAGNGIVNSTSTFSPTLAGVGTHSLTYTVTNLVTGCQTVQTKTITINPLPIVYAGDTLEVCANPNSITLTGYSPFGGVWSGTGIIDATGGVFSTSVAGGIGTHQVIYGVTDNNGCSNKDTLIIDVIYGDTVRAGANDSVCVDATPFLLVGSPLGGVWSGTGVNGATGMFNPNTAGPGSHVVTYTYGAGTCLKTDNKIIYVGTPILIDAGVNQVACVDATQLFLSGASIAGGVWSGTGVINGVTGEFNPQLAGVGFHTVLYTYIDPVTDCESMDTKTVEVKPLPVVDAGGTVTYCDWALDIPLTNYSPTGNGGVWSGPGIVNPTLGTFNTGLAGGIGTYTLTYTFSDNFGCENSDDLTVHVIYGDTVKAGPDITVCIDGGNVQLTGNSPLGGVFSGVGVDSFGVFNPTLTGGGVHPVIYTQGLETCVKSDTLYVTVIDLTGTTAGPNQNTCLESGPVFLTGNSPVGGVWSGSGIIDANLGLFEPLAANNDTVFISYTYTDAASGCSYTDTKMVTINPLPNIDFVMSEDTVCLNDIVTFTNTSDANAGNFKWFFGDGDSSIFFQPTHTYNVAGTYQVMLLGISPAGCPDTTIQTIEVFELATPSFTMSTDDGCGPLQVNFANTSTGQDMTFAWNFGNGQTSTQVNPGMRTFYQGTFDTTYIVTLNVTNRCGVTTFTDTITVRATPTAILGADDNSGCTPLPVNFTNFSTGNATSYFWNFGNGTTSTDSIPPTQFFTTVDTITVYTVTLTALNACGSDSESLDITVEPGSINAFFTPDTTIGCQPLTINFTSLATPNSTVTWDFGDGNTLAGPAATAGVISHVFDTAGVFTVTQYVSNYCGLDTFSVDITVHPGIDVSFAQAAPFACEDATFQFTNTSPQPLAGISWDFGDGGTSTALNPQHVYTTPGTYTVTMTGYSTSFGCPADTQSVIQVFAKPSATFAASANSGCSPVNVNFTNTSSSSALFYAWDFGDGNVSNLPNPSHAFINTGNYVVTLTATDANGCSDDTTMVNFIVFPSPSSSFVPDATSQCGLNDYVVLTNTSQGATQYYWNFGNGQYSNLTNPTINYNQLGDYTITLITQNQYNCNDTIQTLYSVLPGPIADFEIESQNGCEPLTVQFTQASTNSTNFYWYFGDGDSAAVANPIHTYNDGGTYNVTMVASLNNVCFDTFYMPGAVFVDVAPEASFIMTEFNPSNPTGTYNFTNTSIGASTYFWDFGDGNTSTDENPQHRYDYNGLKQVMLVAVSPTGCVDTTIFELQPTFFGGLYVPNAFSPNVGIGDVRVFRPVGVGLKEYKVEVFSQWGELLWESDVLDDAGIPVEGWDGTHNGVLMPQGAYVWKVHAIFEDGSNWEGMPDFNGTVRKVGSVTLLD